MREGNVMCSMSGSQNPRRRDEGAGAVTIKKRDHSRPLMLIDEAIGIRTVVSNNHRSARSSQVNPR